MVYDNSIAGEALEIDAGRFLPDVRMIHADFNAGIYWSVREARGDSIVLNGCDGDEYRCRQDHYVNAVELFH